jgi:hypothetical protein
MGLVTASVIGRKRLDIAMYNIMFSLLAVEKATDTVKIGFDSGSGEAERLETRERKGCCGQ